VTKCGACHHLVKGSAADTLAQWLPEGSRCTLTLLRKS